MRAAGFGECAEAISPEVLFGVDVSHGGHQGTQDYLGMILEVDLQRKYYIYIDCIKSGHLRTTVVTTLGTINYVFRLVQYLNSSVGQLHDYCAVGSVPFEHVRDSR